MTSIVRKLLVAVAAVVSLWTAPMYGQVHVEERHVVMLHPGFDVIWGTYMFGVRNEGSEAAHLEGGLLLPRETVDFQAQEGLSQEEITSGAEGLVFHKDFPPGLTLISVGFKADARFGRGALTFAPKFAVGQFSVVTKKGTLVIGSDSPAMGDVVEATVSDDTFLSLTAKSELAAGQSVTVDVSNIPEGRARLWVAGAVVAALLAGLAIALTLKSLPAVRAQEQAEVA